MDDALAPSTRRILAMGNHEYYGGSRQLWEQTFETKANRRQEVNGYQFITVSPEKGTCDENDYVYLREWLEEKIQEAIAADPTKPVFVVQHYHVFETVYGSASKPGDFHAGVKDFADILERYPQVIHISGHSHIPSYDPRAIWQGKFTAIGTGSMSYFALSLYERGGNFQLGNNVAYQQAGTFLVFDVYKDNTIRIRLYDVISDSFLDREYLLVDPTNVEKYVYTNKRFDAAKPPVWKENASSEIVELAPSGATIRFSQAKDEFCVVSYRIAVEKEVEGQWTPYRTHNVWSDYFLKNQVEKIDYDALNLEPGARYRLNVFGVGAFQKETE
ncbi:MAG: metallophosphoesterase, partial [Thermoguttaceae bacterium]|nr:metallophosphoesterase [Thermoguttaceae bacterium]